MESGKILVICTNSASDRKLYQVLRNAEGLVWDWGQSRYVTFEDEKYLEYAVAILYMGGDVYLAHVRKDSIVLVYIQEGREPDIYDKIYHIYGAEIPKGIPDKIRPMKPLIPHDKHVSRTRSKVVQDHYSE